MKQVIFIRGKYGEICYLVFRGEVQQGPEVQQEFNVNKLVIKVKDFIPVMTKDLDYSTVYSKEFRWIGIPINVEDETGGLLQITEEEDPGVEIRKALEYADHVEDELRFLAARFLGIVGGTKLSAVVIPWRFAV